MASQGHRVMSLRHGGEELAKHSPEAKNWSRCESLEAVRMKTSAIALDSPALRAPPQKASSGRLPLHAAVRTATRSTASCGRMRTLASDSDWEVFKFGEPAHDSEEAYSCEVAVHRSGSVSDCTLR